MAPPLGKAHPPVEESQLGDPASQGQAVGSLPGEESRPPGTVEVGKASGSSLELNSPDKIGRSQSQGLSLPGEGTASGSSHADKFPPLNEKSPRTASDNKLSVGGGDGCPSQGEVAEALPRKQISAEGQRKVNPGRSKRY